MPQINLGHVRGSSGGTTTVEGNIVTLTESEYAEVDLSSYAVGTLIIVTKDTTEETTSEDEDDL